VPFGFCVVWPLDWLGRKQGKILYLVLKGFGCFCLLLWYFGSQTEQKLICLYYDISVAKRSRNWFVYLLFLLYPCVVLVLDNVFCIMPHNCKVHLILVVGDGTKILDFFFLIVYRCHRQTSRDFCCTLNFLVLVKMLTVKRKKWIVSNELFWLTTENMWVTN
jgi:hypothetical protein